MKKCLKIGRFPKAKSPFAKTDGNYQTYTGLD